MEIKICCKLNNLMNLVHSSATIYTILSKQLYEKPLHVVEQACLLSPNYYQLGQFWIFLYKC